MKKFLGQQAERFALKGQCTLCYEPTEGVQKLCIVCSKFEYCSSQCLEDDRSDHVKYCKLSYPELREENSIRSLPRERNSSLEPPRNTPQESPRDTPQNIPRDTQEPSWNCSQDNSWELRFIYIPTVPSYESRFERSDDGRPLPPLSERGSVPRLALSTRARLTNDSESINPDVLRAKRRLEF